MSTPRAPEGDVAAKLTQSSVVGEPRIARAGVTAATVLTHLEAGGVSDNGAETMEHRKMESETMVSGRGQIS